ncbi:hypothetical protein [Clostridium kluyveri]|nr:hypothetical protein [Clostridium kluyveri]UZQ51463.1 hypothetical protein OP486_04590 [Clostridium kluyveri]
MQKFFNSMMVKQNKSLAVQNKKLYFGRILVNGSPVMNYCKSFITNLKGQEVQIQRQQQKYNYI